MLVVDFGCALKRPVVAFSAPADFAGCGVLKPPKKPGLGSSAVFAGPASGLSLF